MERNERQDMLRFATICFARLRQDSPSGGYRLGPKHAFVGGNWRGDILESIGAVPEDVEDGLPVWSACQEAYAETLHEQLGDFLREEWTYYCELLQQRERPHG